ncbi:MAG: hypothetical protein AAGM67_20425 [Bacteroidota bacterium]
MNEWSNVNERREPSWYSKKLIKWRTYGAEAQAFDRLLCATGVSWAKKTHVRKAGIDRNSMAGCSRESIGQMSKHMTAKIDTAYLPELPSEAMHAGAGFSVHPAEAYFVPRASLILPWTQLQIELAIFPHLPRWRAELESEQGDSGPAATNFIRKLLPFLARVAVQDGIHWVERMPEHPVTLLLLRSLPGYERKFSP